MAKDAATEQINIRVSAEEYQIIKAKADKLGLTVSAYIRMIALNTEVSFNIESK